MKPHRQPNDSTPAERMEAGLRQDYLDDRIGTDEFERRLGMLLSGDPHPLDALRHMGPSATLWSARREDEGRASVPGGTFQVRGGRG